MQSKYEIVKGQSIQLNFKSLKDAQIVDLSEAALMNSIGYLQKDIPGKPGLVTVMLFSNTKLILMNIIGIAKGIEIAKSVGFTEDAYLAKMPEYINTEELIKDLKTEANDTIHEMYSTACAAFLIGTDKQCLIDILDKHSTKPKGVYS